MEDCTDGIWRGTRYFTCKPGRAFFCPVTTLIPDQREVASSQASHTPPMYREPIAQPSGPSPHAYREPGQGSTTVPYGGLPAQHLPTAPVPPVYGSSPPTNISVGSTVEVGNPRNPHCGIIRWIGNLPGHEELIAGIEMVCMYIHIRMNNVCI